ncbi:hemolysin family protein [Thermaurantiacus tibetensis]|uniref:hemolysin family protein n=1 Tax=Thermaurantiacus tibetensis TaxID=2759035 RepID=UPI00188F771A|nr:hemolysin family protein [Thermaurantiacus tibetensis]
MGDPSSPPAPPRLWQALKALLPSRGREASLRESLEEAIEEHVEETAAADDLDAGEREMLRNMLDAGDRTAADIATPRSDIDALAEGTGFAEAVAFFRETGHTRVPLYRGSLDDVTGMVHLKDLFAILAGAGPPPATVDPLRRPVLFVPPGKPALDLLSDMRRTRTHMAIVVDEFGGTDGLVTIEDIVEEIVGDIEDEHDEAEPEPLREVAGGFEADARLPLDELEERLGVTFTAEELADEVDTLGGLAVLVAGRVPAVGERIALPNGWVLEILAGDDRRLERLRLHPPAAEEDAEA